MRRPGRGGDQIAIDVHLIDADLRIMAAAQPHLRRAGRVGAAGAAFQHPGRCQQLRAVANGGDRFFRGVKRLHQRDHVGIQAQVFRRPTAGDQERIVVLFFGGGEVGVQGETVAGFLAVGLRAVKIVDRGLELARFIRIHKNSVIITIA